MSSYGHGTILNFKIFTDIDVSLRVVRHYSTCKEFCLKRALFQCKTLNGE